MSINGISGYVPNPILPGSARTNGGDGAADAGASNVRSTSSSAAASAAPVARQAHPMPVDAPEGTDPMLWSVLTSEERSFFARARSMGPVTYGPESRSYAVGAPRGGRIDVKV